MILSNVNPYLSLLVNWDSWYWWNLYFGLYFRMSGIRNERRGNFKAVQPLSGLNSKAIQASVASSRRWQAFVES